MKLSLNFRVRLLMLFIMVVDCPLLALLKLGDCVRGETISAACWELEMEGKWRGRIFRPVVDFFLRPLEPDHCAQAWLAEAYLREEHRRLLEVWRTRGLSNR